MTGKRNGFLALSYTKKQHQETFSGQRLTLVLRPPCKLLFPQKNAQILHFYGLLALGKGKRVWNTISNETRIQVPLAYLFMEHYGQIKVPQKVVCVPQVTTRSALSSSVS